MLQKKSENQVKRQECQKNVKYDALDFTLCPKKYYQDTLAQQTQPNFGTKRTYSDKENQLINFGQSPQNSPKKPHPYPLPVSEPQTKNKKYAYIKNSNSPIHPQKYDFENHFQQPIEPNKKNQVSKTSQSQNSKFSSSQKFQNPQFTSKDDEIAFLRHQLERQKEKFEQFQQQTIKNQIKILDTITNLEGKLKEIKGQNDLLTHQNTCLKAQLQNTQNQSLPRFKRNDPYFQKGKVQSEMGQIQELCMKVDKLSKELRQKECEMGNLEHNYKKVKGVGKGLVDMMKKVDNLSVPEGEDETKYAWKWVKKVVWEYEAIRKKASEWKRAYDELNKDSQNDLSISSDEAY